ncbi:ABC transporter ATP-binding protein [Nocardia alni]|uniref:ABC transporter ATP-binding protein n=1 Tax=Nocardia alni TaxID=2815723 RepID=UPI001C2288C8|nr:ATP-binding cassette domain-containing protein [Nocardia alni]
MTSSTSLSRDENGTRPPDPATAVVEAAGLGVAYGRVQALEGVSMSLLRGETALVLGLNGAGKTTLLKALAGLVEAGTGTVRLGGLDVTAMPTHRRARAGLSLVPEGRGVLPGLSVRDNILLGLHTAPRRRRRSEHEALDWSTAFFPPLRAKMKQDCSTLSGGEMQMLGTARALVADPKVLMIDEPSLGLAPKATATVYQALGRLQEEGISLLIVEQKSVPLVRDPDRVVVLRSGRVVRELRHALPSPEELSEIYLGGETEKEEGAL